jgi:hypothetical protein
VPIEVHHLMVTSLEGQFWGDGCCTNRKNWQLDLGHDLKMEHFSLAVQDRAALNARLKPGHPFSVAPSISPPRSGVLSLETHSATHSALRCAPQVRLCRCQRTLCALQVPETLCGLLCERPYARAPLRLRPALLGASEKPIVEN